MLLDLEPQPRYDAQNAIVAQARWATLLPPRDDIQNSRDVGTAGGVASRKALD